LRAPTNPAKPKKKTLENYIKAHTTIAAYQWGSERDREKDGVEPLINA
jgi:hypothetical protein